MRAKMIDLHCHILPGLDDGAQNLQEAIAMAKMAEKDGVEKIVATPHLFRGHAHLKDLSLIEEKREELSRALEENNIHLEILRGAEVHISHNLIQEIRKNKKDLVLNKSSYLFIEFPSDHVFSGAKNLLFDLMNEGLTPIIAHPERNSVFIRNPDFLYELIQMGSLSQANSGSFLGIYGVRTAEAVSRFLKLGLIHFIASDGHNTRSIVPRLSEAIKKIEGIMGEEKARYFVQENPLAVLENREPPYLPSATNPKEKEKSFYLKIPTLLRRKKLI
jgi:protein-tyrosine phosphatase